MDENKSAMGVEFDVAFDDIELSYFGSILRHFSLKCAFDMSDNNIFFSLMTLLSRLLVISRWITFVLLVILNLDGVEWTSLCWSLLFIFFSTITTIFLVGTILLFCSKVSVTSLDFFSLKSVQSLIPYWCNCDWKVVCIGRSFINIYFAFFISMFEIEILFDSMLLLYVLKPFFILTLVGSGLSLLDAMLLRFSFSGLLSLNLFDAFDIAFIGSCSFHNISFSWFILLSILLFTAEWMKLKLLVSSMLSSFIWA